MQPMDVAVRHGLLEEEILADLQELLADLGPEAEKRPVFGGMATCNWQGMARFWSFDWDERVDFWDGKLDVFWSPGRRIGRCWDDTK